MGLLSRLFGKSEIKVIQDSDFGEFNELNHKRDEFIWKGHVKLFDQTIALYMSGNSIELNFEEKKKLLYVLKNETDVELEINKTLQEQYNETDKHYLSWQNHFNCITISTIGDESSITFEEKDTLYQFNVFLLDCKATGVSIDS